MPDVFLWLWGGPSFRLGLFSKNFLNKFSACCSSGEYLFLTINNWEPKSLKKTALSILYIFLLF
jgi:hypothetical protein